MRTGTTAVGRNNRRGNRTDRGSRSRAPKFTCKSSKRSRLDVSAREQRHVLNSILAGKKGIYSFHVPGGMGAVKVYDYRGYTEEVYIEILDGTGSLEWMRNRDFSMPVKALKHKNSSEVWKFIPELKTMGWRLIDAISKARKFAQRQQ